ncbi:Hsp20/alpha crystallin family protein [Candidatus Pacearchaeota archaeon]|nr:Hsp20/alpha crystallin family protein [Candidatus Pacearchaeota archaeon]
MSFFDEDPFENIVRDFFGQRSNLHSSENIIKGEDDERIIDFIETKDKLFLVFELPGYSEKDIKVDITKKEIEITAKKNNLENIQEYLARKLSRGEYFKKILPSFVNHKKVNHTFKNGVLEIYFEKRK